MNLQKNSIETIAKYSRYSPTLIEDVIERHGAYRSKVDSLQRSLNFFNNEFEGKEEDKAKSIDQIQTELATVQNELQSLQPPQPIGQLSRTYPFECEKGLQILINDLRLFFQVDNMISTDSIKSLCPMIISEYPSLTLEEIVVCFTQAKKGYYGEVYNRLDGQIILKWIRLYYADKIDRLRVKQQNQHTISKSDLCYREPLPSNSELLNEAISKIELDKNGK